MGTAGKKCVPPLDGTMTSEKTKELDIFEKSHRGSSRMPDIQKLQNMDKDFE